MAKKKQDYQHELFAFLETKPTEPVVTFPLCIKFQNSSVYKPQVNYYRYCEDGRYECISEDQDSISLVFGKTHLYDKDNIWIKTLFFRARGNYGGQSLITNEEFEKAFEIYISHTYTEYLAGRKFVDERIAMPNVKENKIEESIFNDSKPAEEAPF